MRRIRLRIALPVFHMVIDLLLLLACLRIAYIDSREAKEPFVWLQNYDSDPSVVNIDWKVLPPLAAVAAGTMPVSIVTTLVFPRYLASIPFDLRWVGLHLALGIAFWYAVGWFGERNKQWRICLLGYLLLRAITVPLYLSPRRSDWSYIQDIVFMAFWLAAIVLAVWTTVAAIMRKRSRGRQDAATEA